MSESGRDNDWGNHHGSNSDGVNSSKSHLSEVLNSRDNLPICFNSDSSKHSMCLLFIYPSISKCLLRQLSYCIKQCKNCDGRSADSLTD